MPRAPLKLRQGLAMPSHAPSSSYSHLRVAMSSTSLLIPSSRELIDRVETKGSGVFLWRARVVPRGGEQRKQASGRHAAYGLGFC